MKLVSNWRDFWRWHSVQIAALIAALPVAWTAMPDDLKAYVPDEWRPYIAGGLFIAFVIGRLRDQGK